MPMAPALPSVGRSESPTDEQPAHAQLATAKDAPGSNDAFGLFELVMW